MSIKKTQICPKCNLNLKDGKYSKLIGVEYSYSSPYHYDGISEWMCPSCGYREGRWSGQELQERTSELPPRLQPKS